MKDILNKSKISTEKKKIKQYFIDLYHEKRWKFWAIVAGIILIFLAILIILVIHFSNQTEEQNIHEFVNALVSLKKEFSYAAAGV